MIDNIILLITGTLHERDTTELVQRCHPLGMYDDVFLEIDFSFMITMTLSFHLAFSLTLTFCFDTIPYS